MRHRLLAAGLALAAALALAGCHGKVTDTGHVNPQASAAAQADTLLGESVLKGCLPKQDVTGTDSGDAALLAYLKHASQRHVAEKCVEGTVPASHRGALGICLAKAVVAQHKDAHDAAGEATAETGILTDVGACVRANR
jgi:hypothetical protein